MVSIKQLYDLQELDWELSASEKSLAEVRVRLADDSALVSAKRRLEQLESQLAERLSMRDQRESIIQQLGEKQKAVEGRLYGGAVTNARELTAIEEERLFIQGQRGEEEDNLLELMVEIEDLQPARDQTREQLAQLETERSAEYPKLLKAEERLTAELIELRQARADMTPQIPPVALSVYETLLKSRGGQAVAKVERSMCQGCRITLPTVEVQRAKASQGIVQCNSCHRILYVA